MPINDEDKKPTLTSFCFKKDLNPALEEDLQMEIRNDTIITGFSQGVKDMSLIASFEGDFQSIEVDGVGQVSDVSKNDFNTKVIYELTGLGGQKSHYVVILKGYNGVPVLNIRTKDAAPILTKTEYVPAEFEFLNCSATDGISFSSKGKIRGRGNASFDYEKKPYKIKFEKKQSPFGFPENKDWVLLAEWSDKSFLRVAYQCELSKLMKMPYTINYQHVDLWLNDEYNGTYLLVDQVKKGKNRVSIEDDGFLIEHDYYYQQEALWFESSLLGEAFSFKYPDADDGEIVEGDDNFNFIVDFVHKMENSLLNIDNDPNEYRNYIDTQSFAKWYLAQEILNNCDPNRFYVLPSRLGKLMMYPMWDPEWCLGLAIKDPIWRLPPFEPSPEGATWNEKFYFKYLFKDPAFVQEVKKEWNEFRPYKDELIAKIDSVATEIKYTQAANFERWPIIGVRTHKVQLVVMESWEEEVAYVRDYISKRLNWMDDYISNLTTIF